MGKRLRDVLIFLITAVTLVAIVYLSRAVGVATVPVPTFSPTPAPVTTELMPVKQTRVGELRREPAESASITLTDESETSNSN